MKKLNKTVQNLIEIFKKQNRLLTLHEIYQLYLKDYGNNNYKVFEAGIDSHLFCYCRGRDKLKKHQPLFFSKYRKQTHRGTNLFGLYEWLPYEEILDDIKEVNNTKFEKEYNKIKDIKDFKHTDKPISLNLTKKKIVEQSYFNRDQKAAAIAYLLSNQKCELDNNHKSFISKNNNEIYLEKHHIIPLSKQSEFSCSLDVPANIICLCSECHNLIHYGKNRNIYIQKIYEMRKQRIEEAGIYCSLDDLIKMYDN